MMFTPSVVSTVTNFKRHPILSEFRPSENFPIRISLSMGKEKLGDHAAVSLDG